MCSALLKNENVESEKVVQKDANANVGGGSADKINVEASVVHLIFGPVTDSSILIVAPESRL